MGYSCANSTAAREAATYRHLLKPLERHRNNIPRGSKRGSSIGPPFIPTGGNISGQPRTNSSCDAKILLTERVLSTFLPYIKCTKKSLHLMDPPINGGSHRMGPSTWYVEDSYIIPCVSRSVIPKNIPLFCLYMYLFGVLMAGIVHCMYINTHFKQAFTFRNEKYVIVKRTRNED